MIEEQPVCACGLDMVPIKLGASTYKCPNCDTARKIRSPQDGRFQLEWERRKRRFYPEQGRTAA